MTRFADVAHAERKELAFLIREYHDFQVLERLLDKHQAEQDPAKKLALEKTITSFARRESRIERREYRNERNFEQKMAGASTTTKTKRLSSQRCLRSHRLGSS